jgi:hypothetical protein
MEPIFNLHVVQDTNASAATRLKRNMACDMKLLCACVQVILFLLAVHIFPGLYNDVEIFRQGLIHILDAVV